MSVGGVKRKAVETATRNVKTRSITSFFKSVRSEVSKEEKSKPEITEKSLEVTETTLELKKLSSLQEQQTVDTKISSLESLPTFSGFDKDKWFSLLPQETQQLLQLEYETMGVTWLASLHKELTKPYFLTLKRKLKEEFTHHTIFPPESDIYSWSRFTSVDSVRVIILGQDPYHNYNQAHGLAFSVKPPTRPPPSLANIYKGLRNDYADFTPPVANSGLLTPWAEQGVLLLNSCLTVRAHQANSHAKKLGWEQFTEAVLKCVVEKSPRGVVVMAWGRPASDRADKLKNSKTHILKSVHPSPLSAARGFFTCRHFRLANEWLLETYGADGLVDWSLTPGKPLAEVERLKNGEEVKQSEEGEVNEKQ